MIFLKNKTGLTWGNISSHTTKLEEADYLEIEKVIFDKKTRTTLRLTEKGKKAFENYRESILKMLG
jgi:DNA-binding MarR family transcriptional regulator